MKLCVRTNCQLSSPAVVKRLETYLSSRFNVTFAEGTNMERSLQRMDEVIIDVDDNNPNIRECVRATDLNFSYNTDKNRRETVSVKISELASQSVSPSDEDSASFEIIDRDACSTNGDASWTEIDATSHPPVTRRCTGNDSDRSAMHMESHHDDVTGQGTRNSPLSMNKGAVAGMANANLRRNAGSSYSDRSTVEINAAADHTPNRNVSVDKKAFEVKIEGLPAKTGPYDLYNFVNSFGHTVKRGVRVEPGGIVYVQYNQISREMIVKLTKQTEILGRKVHITVTEATLDMYRLFVDNIPLSISRGTLFQIFREYGWIEDILCGGIKLVSIQGCPFKHAFVTYCSIDIVKYALDYIHRVPIILEDTQLIVEQCTEEHRRRSVPNCLSETASIASIENSATVEVPQTSTARKASIPRVRLPRVSKDGSTSTQCITASRSQPQMPSLPLCQENAANANIPRTETPAETLVAQLQTSDLRNLTLAEDVPAVAVANDGQTGRLKVIQVRNVNHTDEMLRRYFENTKRSKGGKIMKIEVIHESNLAIIEFQRVEDAENVLSQASHTLESKILYVSRLPPVSDVSVFVPDVPEDVDLETFRTHMEARTKLDVRTIRFSANTKSALVTFDESIQSMEVLRANLSNEQRKLKGQLITAAPVYYPDGILVYGVAKDAHEDSFILPIEHFLSSEAAMLSSCDVKYVWKKEDGVALVVFDDYQAVNMFEDTFELEADCKVKVQPYFDVLGFLPPNNRADFLREHKGCRTVISLPHRHAQVLATDYAKQHVEKVLAEKKIVCEWTVVVDTNDSKMSVTAKTDGIAQLIGQQIKGCLKEIEMPLGAEALAYLDDAQFEAFMSQLVQEIKGVCRADKTESSLQLLGLDNLLPDFSERIRAHLEASVKYRQRLIKHKGLVLYLHTSKECMRDLIRLENKHSVTLIWNIAEGQVSVEAPKPVLAKLKPDVQEIAARVKLMHYNIKRPGMPEYFRSDAGRSKLRELANSSDTVILPADEDRVDEQQEGPNFIEEISTVSGCVFRGTFKRLKVCVIKGDMTKLRVDGIVNAANEDLLHGGGLAGAILKAAGPSVQEESFQIVRSFGRVSVGSCKVTGAGNLPCKRIIHAVGPKWAGGDAGEETKLQNAIIQCIVSAKLEQLKSVAIPALSCGVYGYPHHKAIPVIVNAALNAASINERSCLKEVLFVDVDDQNVRLFEKTCITFGVSSEDAHEQLTPAADVRAGEDSLEDDSSLIEKVVLREPEQQPDHKEPAGASNVSMIRLGNITLSLLRGGIATQRADVIVNTTSVGNLNGGGASCQALFQAGGQALVHDVKAKYPHGLGQTLVGVTSGGQLPCRNVFHVAVGHFVNDFQPITDRVAECIRLANVSGYTSIAFPAIATGGLGYPKDGVAKAMFDAIATASRNARSVTDVRFVLFDTATITAFEQELASRKANDKDQPMLSLRSDVPAAISAEGCAVKIGDIRVEVLKGDLTKQAVECVLVPTNAHLDFNIGGVAQALIKTFPSLADQLKTKKVGANGLLLLRFKDSTAKFTHLLCVDAPTLLTDWTELLQKGLKLLESKSIGSLGLPAIGTGAHSHDVNDVAEMLLNCIERFARTKPNTLKHVKVVIYQDFMRKFANHVTALIEDGSDAARRGKEGGGILKRISEFGCKIFGLKPGEVDRARANVTHLDSQELNLPLHIYGTEESSKLAAQMLDTECKEHCPRREIVYDTLKMLTPTQTDELHMLATLSQVIVQFDRSCGLVIVEGRHADDYVAKLHQYLGQVREAHSSYDHVVQWHEKHGEKWLAIDKMRSMEIENAYREVKGKGKMKLDSDIVNFDKWVVTRDSTDIPIKRRTADDRIPVFWDSSSSNPVFGLVTLTPRSDEYRMVENEVNKSAVVNIQQIERVEMPTRYMQYAAQKEACDRALGRNSEMFLFHGTKDQNVDAICREGFNRSLSGQNGIVYGHGSYFATTFDYSSRYGPHKIFLSQVIVGEWTVGNQQTQTAPVNLAKPGAKFDSTVDNQQTPTIFVVYTDNHAYPSYVITYTP